jgi:hypothetical protein
MDAQSRNPISRVAGNISAEIGSYEFVSGRATVADLTAVDYDIARGRDAAYCPEANVPDRHLLWLTEYRRCADEDQCFGHRDQDRCN